jgi:hypothetical protein
MKSWSRGRCWDVMAPGRKEGVILLTVHDAPEWIARSMLAHAETFIAPLELIPVANCNTRTVCKAVRIESEGDRS